MATAHESTIDKKYKISRIIAHKPPTVNGRATKIITRQKERLTTGLLFSFFFLTFFFSQ